MHRFIVAILLLAAPHGAFASPGALFAEPDFFTLGPGIGVGISDDTGALGDVDGDGDVDLVTAWNRWGRTLSTLGLDGGVQRRLG